MDDDTDSSRAPHTDRDAASEQLDIERQVSLLRDEVTALQLQAAEKKRPWYKERSTLVALASLLVSLSGIAERYWVRAEEATEKQLQSVRDIMVSAAELQVEWSQVRMEGLTNYNRGVAMNTKRQLLLQSARALLKSARVHYRTSANVHLALGYEMMSDGRYGDAETDFRYAITAATRDNDSMTQVLCKRTLGQLYGVRGTGLGSAATLQQRSRELFNEAATLLSNRTDDFGLKTLSETYLLQAQIEVAYGDVEFGKKQAVDAKQYIAKIHEANPVRKTLLAFADQLIAGKVPTAETSVSPGEIVATAPSPAPAPAMPVATELEIWTPMPGSTTGATMRVVVDGRDVGELSNLKTQRRIQIGRLSPGVHRFELTQVAFYFMGAGGAATIVASDLSCASEFSVPPAGVRRLWIQASNPTSVACGVQ